MTKRKRVTIAGREWRMKKPGHWVTDGAEIVRRCEIRWRYISGGVDRVFTSMRQAAEIGTMEDQDKT